MPTIRYAIAACLLVGLCGMTRAQDADAELPPGMERYEKDVSRRQLPTFQSERRRRSRGGTIAIEGDDVQQLFMDMGVRFPPGSTIRYNSVSSKLVVTNTPEQLAKVARILDEIIRQPSQLAIHVAVLRVPHGTVSDWGLDGLPPAKKDQSPFKGPVPRYLTPEEAATLMAGLRAVKGFEVVTSTGVITLSGQTANTRIVERTRLVSEYTEPEVVVSENGKSVASPTTPVYGEEERFGGQLTVTPTVGEDEATIDLELNPTFTDILGWYAVPVTDWTGKPSEMRIPIVQEYSVETRVLVMKGDYVLLNAAHRLPPAMQALKDSGRVADPEKDGAIFFLLTADLVKVGKRPEVELVPMR